jgi:uncharacterized repeat protein (TIGR01451 family)
MEARQRNLQPGNLNHTRRKTMNHRFTTHLAAVAAGALLLVGASQSFAGGTASGTDISNQATLGYTVGAVPQTAVPSNTITFKVDKKVDLTVVTQDTAIVSVVPGATSQVLTFTVTNTGNDTQDINLSALALTAGTANPFGGALTDTFDATVVGIFVDANDDDVYDAGDTGTFIDELAPDADKTVFIVRTIDLAQVNNDVAVYALVAAVRAGGSAGSEGGALTATAPAAVSDGVADILFADGAGSDDGASNAQFSARSAFLVVTATMGVTKAQAIGGGFAIPGATVTYTITIANTGAAAASSVVLVDPIPANTTYDAFTTCSGTKAWSDDNATSWLAAEPGDKTTVTHVRCTIASIAAAANDSVVFEVTID